MMKNLKILRERSRMSQYDLGLVLHISQQAIWKYEKNLSQPSNATLRNMSEHFKVPADILINDDISIDDYMNVRHAGITNRERRLLNIFRRMNENHKEAIEGLMIRVSNSNHGRDTEKIFDRFDDVF